MALQDLTAVLYLFGTMLLVPGTVLLLPKYAAQYATAIYCLIAATSCLTLAAVGDLTPVLGRCCARRQPAQPNEGGYGYGATGGAAGNQLVLAPEHDDRPTGRELFGGIFMVLGGTFFLVASLLYMPGVDTQYFIDGDAAADGTWVFRIGSIWYLCGSACSLIGIRHQGGVIVNQRATFGSLCYVVGAILYIAGGVLSELKKNGFALTWIVGSVFFVMGAVAFATPTLIHGLCACCIDDDEDDHGPARGRLNQ